MLEFTYCNINMFNIFLMTDSLMQECFMIARKKADLRVARFIFKVKTFLCFFPR